MKTPKEKARDLLDLSQVSSYNKKREISDYFNKYGYHKTVLKYPKMKSVIDLLKAAR